MKTTKREKKNRKKDGTVKNFFHSETSGCRHSRDSKRVHDGDSCRSEVTSSDQYKLGLTD